MIVLAFMGLIGLAATIFIPSAEVPAGAEASTPTAPAEIA
jgi:hypothetical protein